MHLTGNIVSLSKSKTPKGMADKEAHVTNKSMDVLIGCVNKLGKELGLAEKDIVELLTTVKRLEEEAAAFRAFKPLLEQLQAEQNEKKASELSNYLKGKAS
jgi:hypothetical protein